MELLERGLMKNNLDTFADAHPCVCLGSRLYEIYECAGTTHHLHHSDASPGRS
jgi:hypothetical protein